MVEEMCDTDDKRNLVHAGGGHAVIYGPDGSPLAEKLPETEEGITYATIDLGAIGVAKNAADPAGHYSRPDVLRGARFAERMRRRHGHSRNNKKLGA
jgi:nitrilase